MIAIALICALAGAPVPQRVVSQTVGTDEILVALADPGQIAALSRFSDDPAFSVTAREAAAYPSLRTDDAESVIRFRPDLVLVASYTAPETLALLRRAGVKLIVVDRFESLDDVYANVRVIGAALGHRDRAESLVRDTQRRVAELALRLRGVQPVRVLAVSTYPFTAGAQTTFQDVCDHAAAINVAAEAGLVGHAATPQEKLLTWKPEVLVASDNEGPDLTARLVRIPSYAHLPALQAGKLVLLSGALLGSVTHHRVAAFEQLARRLHPERFP